MFERALDRTHAIRDLQRWFLQLANRADDMRRDRRFHAAKPSGIDVANEPSEQHAPQVTRIAFVGGGSPTIRRRR
jgi:hypothetical protein